MIKITIGTIEIEFKNYDDFAKFCKEFESLLKTKEPVYIPQPYPIYPAPDPNQPWITWKWGDGTAICPDTYVTKTICLDPALDTQSSTYIMTGNEQVSYTTN